MPLNYHAGQLAIQAEAKTSRVAGMLAHWEGPVAEFAGVADMLLFARADSDGRLSFSLLSGPAPLVSISGEGPDLRLRFPPGLAPFNSGPKPCGGLAINLRQARRARINGVLVEQADGVAELAAAETFTLCRKYMAPWQIPAGSQPVLGPRAREPLALDDPWLAGLIAKAETAFLASVSPEGMPDVAHRGGPAGFIQVDAAAHQLTWPEYVGDGVFKSAGNVRATGNLTLLVPDMESGDGVELIGRGGYTNQRTERSQRPDALVQHREPFPLQGVITCEIAQAVRLRQLLHPRTQAARTTRITSQSAVRDRAPQ